MPIPNLASNRQARLRVSVPPWLHLFFLLRLRRAVAIGVICG